MKHPLYTIEHLAEVPKDCAQVPWFPSSSVYFQTCLRLAELLLIADPNFCENLDVLRQMGDNGPEALVALFAIKLIEVMMGQEPNGIRSDGRFIANIDELTTVSTQIASLPDSIWMPRPEFVFTKKEIVDAWERNHPGSIEHSRMAETLQFVKGPTV